MENFKVLKYESEDFPGYSYIKVYNKNANKENMINEINSMINVDKIIRFENVKDMNLILRKSKLRICIGYIIYK